MIDVRVWICFFIPTIVSYCDQSYQLNCVISVRFKVPMTMYMKTAYLPNYTLSLPVRQLSWCHFCLEYLYIVNCGLSDV
jgi:hypothetical protein